MPPNTPPPPQRAEPLTLVLKGLKVVVPPAGIVALAVLLTPGLAYMVLPGGTATPLEHGPIPAPVPQVPLLSSTPATLPVLAMVLPGKLPPPGPNQLRAGKCDKRAAEVEVNGGCWIKTETPPPCPEGIQWEHEGRCWRPVAPTARMPTTGDPGTLPVAAPVE